MRVLAVIVIPIALWFALILIFLWIPLPAPLPPPLASERNKIGAALTGVAGIAYLVFLVSFVIGEMSWAAKILDAAVKPLGLTARPQLPGARAFDGEMDGRRVTVSFLPPASLQRSMLTAYATTRMPARVSIGWTTPLAGCAGCPRVPIEDSALSGLVVLADDAEWTRRLLARPRSSALVLDLLAEPDALGNRFLHMEPGKVWLQARPTADGIAVAGHWVRALVDLAAECESASAPR